MVWRGSRRSQGCEKVSGRLDSVCLNHTAGLSPHQSKCEGLGGRFANIAKENNSKDSLAFFPKYRTMDFPPPPALLGDCHLTLRLSGGPEMTRDHRHMTT